MDQTISKKQLYKFILSENIKDIRSTIASLLPKLNTEWTEEIDEKNQKIYTTKLSNIKIKIEESKVSICYTKFNDPEGVFEVEKVISEELSNGKPVKSKLYSLLSERFQNRNDYEFYENVLKTMTEHVSMEEQMKNMELEKQKDANKRTS